MNIRELKDIVSLFEKVDAYLTDMGLTAHYVEDFKALDDKLTKASEQAMERDIKIGLFRLDNPECITEDDSFRWGLTRYCDHSNLLRIEKEIDNLTDLAERRVKNA